MSNMLAERIGISYLRRPTSLLLLLRGRRGAVAARKASDATPPPLSCAQRPAAEALQGRVHAAAE
eukprot:5283943-Pleurochrysis_carterae.AAC.10